MIKERIWCTVRERALARGFSFNTEHAECPCVYRRTKLSSRVRTKGGQRGSSDREFTRVCSLFSLGPVASEVLEEEVVHDHVCVLCEPLSKTRTKPTIRKYSTKTQQRGDLKKCTKLTLPFLYEWLFSLYSTYPFM